MPEGRTEGTLMSGQCGLRIETERLVIRSAQANDAEKLSALWDAVGAVKPWNTRTPDEMRARISAADPNCSAGWFIHPVERREDSALVGEVHFTHGPHGGQAEIGYSVHPAAQGRGFATEALVAMLDHLFGPAEMHRCTALIIVENAASQRLVTKLGFQLEGRQRENYFVGGMWRDDYVYGLLAKEWRGRAAMDGGEHYAASCRSSSP